MILESQFDKVMGRQFLISFKFFPSFGSKDRADSKCDRGKIPVSTLTRPAWAGFKTAEEGIAIIMSYIL